MAKAADRNTVTYTYAAHPYSNATGDVPVVDLKSGGLYRNTPSIAIHQSSDLTSALLWLRL